MQKSVFKNAVAVLLCSVVSGCLGTSEISKSITSNSLRSSWVRPADPQHRVGAVEHPQVLAKYGGAYANTKAENLIAVIVGRLVDVSEDPGRVYKITLLNSPKVNAFALPGGYLYVTRGLLALANDSSELAAVIAHEMAHVTANHAILRRDKAKSAAIGEKVVAEVLGQTRAAKVAIESNKIQLANFSQDQELQADAVGIRMIGKAGFDAFAAARFLETMGKYQAYLNKGRLGSSGGFLSSHPSTPKRIALARRHARFFGAPGVGDRGRDRYLRGIDGILFGDSAEEGFVRGRKFAHSGLGIEFSAPNGYKVENQPSAVTITGNGDIATRFDAAIDPKNLDLVSYVKSGWVNGLDESTVKTETIAGLPAVSALARGEGWHFKIIVIQSGEQLFRFITAGPVANDAIFGIADKVAGSFKLLSAAEIAALSPLKVRVMKAPAGASLGSMGAKMQVSRDAVELFKITNDITPGRTIATGGKYKVVAE